MSEQPIYLDYHATTPVDPRVAQVIMHYLTIDFGNPSSADHDYGYRAERAVAKAAQQVASLIGAAAQEVIFTSGATESINLALQGHVFQHFNQTQTPCRIAVMPLEHKAVLDTCYCLRKRGMAEIVEIPVSHTGQMDLATLEALCESGLDLICLMAANNEVGTLYPVKEVAKLASRYGIPVFCDASQAVGKVALQFTEWGLTYLALTAHKMYGPKGCGALIVSKDVVLEPLLFGGGHQRGMRSGTMNVPGIAGLGEACALRQQEMLVDESEIQRKRDTLQQALAAHFPELVINGDLQARLAGNLHISLPGISNQAVIGRIRSRLCISAGSACASKAGGASHVLQALQLAPEHLRSALRIGIGKFTTDADISQAIQILTDVIGTLRPRQ